MLKKYFMFAILASILSLACDSKNSVANTTESTHSIYHDTSYKTIHILTALCDNQYQGIVPVPKAIGNGQDPNNNLYWGCKYGIRTYFKQSKNWSYLSSKRIDSVQLERIVFKHKRLPYYLIADAYNGKEIKQCTTDFLNSACGQLKDTIHTIDKKIIGINGHAQLVTYIGHDGLMDFTLQDSFINKDKVKRDVAILACYSKHFFSPHLIKANVNPILWTTGLMCPEAYTIHDAIDTYLAKENNIAIQNNAAHAYSKYLKCKVGAAKKLLVTGW